MNHAIEVKNLSKTFRTGFWGHPTQILHNIDFYVKVGQTTGFVGANGSGKTTSLKCLLEFIFPESGEISFYGQKLNLNIKKKIGYLPERPYYQEFLTGMEFLKFHWQLRGASSLQFIDEAHAALKKVDLYDVRDRRIRSFSKGMMQRVGLAQAIMGQPELLILDEPMSGLDPDGRLMVKDILAEQKKKGITIFFSSHLLQDMEELCTELLLIHKGRVLYNGEMRSFISQFPSLEEAYRHHRDLSVITQKKENSGAS